MLRQGIPLPQAPLAGPVQQKSRTMQEAVQAVDAGENPHMFALPANAAGTARVKRRLAFIAPVPGPFPLPAGPLVCMPQAPAPLPVCPEGPTISTPRPIAPSPHQLSSAPLSQLPHRVPPPLHLGSWHPRQPLPLLCLTPLGCTGRAYTGRAYTSSCCSATPCPSACHFTRCWSAYHCAPTPRSASDCRTDCLCLSSSPTCCSEGGRVLIV